MKAKFTTTDPKEIRCLAKSQDIAVALWNIVYNIPREVERIMDASEEFGSAATAREVLEIYNQTILDELDHHNIIINDLTE